MSKHVPLTSKYPAEQLPTAVELAQIAATLYGSMDYGERPSDAQMVREAFLLWEMCRAELNEKREAR